MHDTIKDALKRENVICGVKQVKKVLKNGSAAKVYLASDAVFTLTDPLAKLAEDSDVPVVWVATMYMLGKMCGIDVGCSAAAILNR